MTPADEAPRPADDDPLTPRMRDAVGPIIGEPRAFTRPDVGGVSLEQLARACRQAATPTRSAPDLLQTAIDRLLRGAFTVQDCATLADIQRLADEGLGVAMTHRLDGAASRFLRANRVLAESPLGPRARAMAESLLWGREAQSETRAGRFEWASELLEAAFEHDLDAEDAGLGLMLAHRVHLAHARLQLDSARGRLGEALLLGAGLLHYLERPGDVPCANLRAVWRRGWRDHRGVIDAALAADLHRRIAQDMVALLATLESKGAAAAVLELRRFQPVEPSQAAGWARFHIARLEGDAGRRTELARTVLSAGPRPSAPLCLSVAEAVLG